MKLTDIDFVKVDPIRNIKRMVSLKSAARRIREHNRIHYATERNSLIITEILESCARLLEDIDAGKVKYVKYGEWKWVDDDPNNTDLICTACREIQDCGHFKFCPNCGATIRGKEND